MLTSKSVSERMGLKPILVSVKVPEFLKSARAAQQTIVSAVTRRRNHFRKELVWQKYAKQFRLGVSIRIEHGQLNHERLHLEVQVVDGPTVHIPFDVLWMSARATEARQALWSKPHIQITEDCIGFPLKSANRARLANMQQRTVQRRMGTEDSFSGWAVQRRMHSGGRYSEEYATEDGTAKDAQRGTVQRRTVQKKGAHILSD